MTVGIAFLSTMHLASLADIDGKTTVILRSFVAGNEIAVETPAKSSVAARNMLNIVKLEVEIPVIWQKTDDFLKLAGEMGVTYLWIPYSQPSSLQSTAPPGCEYAHTAAWDSRYARACDQLPDSRFRERTAAAG
jgi:hypothetical protein